MTNLFHNTMSVLTVTVIVLAYAASVTGAFTTYGALLV